MKRAPLVRKWVLVRNQHQELAVSDNRDERAWTGEGGPQLGEDLKLPAVPRTGVIVTRSRSQGAVPSSRLLVRKAVRRLRQARQLSRPGVGSVLHRDGGEELRRG